LGINGENYSLHFDDAGRWCIVERNLVKHERFEANVITGLLGNLIFFKILRNKVTAFRRRPKVVPRLAEPYFVCAFCSDYYDRLNSKEG